MNIGITLSGLVSVATCSVQYYAPFLRYIFPLTVTMLNFAPPPFNLVFSSLPPIWFMSFDLSEKSKSEYMRPETALISTSAAVLAGSVISISPLMELIENGFPAAMLLKVTSISPLIVESTSGPVTPFRYN